jgi:VIT1/CCC1 family predicted Fe2+/Mn2+ transporter
MPLVHRERHRTSHIGWLRASVLGANDGIVSTASLMVGIAAANTARADVLVAGVAALVAGAMAMAAGEYVSVSSQADTERADLAKERHELDTAKDHELQELADIYIGRGLDAPLAQEVARQLMAHDDIGAHARDELGITEAASARPLTAAIASALAFSAGAALPLLTVLWMPQRLMVVGVSVTSLFFLTVLGALSARAGGAPIAKAAFRVTAWGAFALAATAGVGMLFGARA